MEVPQVVRTYVETFTADGLDQWIATFATDGAYSDPRTVQPVMKHDLAAYFDGLFAGFPDLRCETVALGSISEHVWVWRFVLHGTNTGSFRGLPATGRSVKCRLVSSSRPAAMRSTVSRATSIA